MDRTLLVYFPAEKSGASEPGAFEVCIQDRDNEYTVYDSVKQLIKEYHAGKKPCQHDMAPRIPLMQIINLHNTDGIQDLSRITAMLADIQAGKVPLMENGIPNVKLVISGEGEYVLFDGHHTLLAYMIAGRILLSQVPHIIVTNTGSGFVTDEEIHVFFGEHAPKLRHRDWREYVLNWQAPKENQLCLRIQKNMGELSAALSEEMIRAGWAL